MQSLQARIEALRTEEADQEGEGHDRSALTQSSATMKVSSEGILTFGLDLQFLTDELSNMKPVWCPGSRGGVSRAARAGRASMGSRASCLGAAAVAFRDQGAPSLAGGFMPLEPAPQR